MLCNIILSIAHQLRGRNHFEPPFYLATVESDTNLLGCAVRARPDGIFLSALPVDSVRQIVVQVRGLYSALPEVIGPELIATEFAMRWSGQDWELHERSCCYELTAVDGGLRLSPGILRAGDESDLVWLRDWASDYERETGTRVDLDRFYSLMIERGLLYIWDDSGPRCVVTTSKLTPTGAEISSLYTPPSFRRNGYATSAVAAASRRVLDSGRRYCFISANDQADSTKRIYERIGYKSIDPMVVIHLN